jgi:hypothetical protein
MIAGLALNSHTPFNSLARDHAVRPVVTNSQHIGGGMIPAFLCATSEDFRNLGSHSDMPRISESQI